MFVSTVFLMLAKQRVWNVFCSKDFRFENAGYLIMGLLICIIFYFLNRNFGERIEKFLRRWNKVLLASTLVLLLISQMYFSFGGYFESGWDPGVIHDTVSYEITHEYQNIDSSYFSRYPNNKLIVFILTSIARTVRFCGIKNWEYALVVFQLILAVATMFLVFRVSFAITKSYRFSWAAYSIACLFVCISPWYIVVYSDATALIIPLLIIRIYLLSMDSDNKFVRLLSWFLIGVLASIGLLIKPQTFIVCIAAVIVEILVLLAKRNKQILQEAVIRLFLLVAGVALFNCIFLYSIAPSLHIENDNNASFGYQHYLMMGLNSETDGIYSDEDYNYTLSFSTKEERNEADMQRFKERIQSYGIKGLMYHLCRKQLVNYGDGTFAWAVEGNSFNGDPKWAQNSSSNLVRSFIKPDGSHYENFLSYMQLIWVTLVFFLCFVVFYQNRVLGFNSDQCIVLMMLSIIGLTLFELLFEARARYLFCYSPVFVILGTFGIRNAFRIVDNHIH